MSAQQSGKSSSADVGRNFRWAGTSHSVTKYVSSGGPARMAKRKAKNHGCGMWQMHTRPADLAHSGMAA